MRTVLVSVVLLVACQTSPPPGQQRSSVTVVASATKQPEEIPAPPPVESVVPPGAEEMKPQEIDDYDMLVGEWVSPIGGEFPKVGVVKGREGSKTPYNIHFRDLQSRGMIEGGCGFYPTGTAFCKWHDNDPEELKSKETKLTAVLHGVTLTVAIDDVVTLELGKLRVE